MVAGDLVSADGAFFVDEAGDGSLGVVSVFGFGRGGSFCGGFEVIDSS